MTKQITPESELCDNHSITDERQQSSMMLCYAIHNTPTTSIVHILLVTLVGPWPDLFPLPHYAYGYNQNHNPQFHVLVIKKCK